MQCNTLTRRKEAIILSTFMHVWFSARWGRGGVPVTGTLTHSQAHDIAGPSLPQISLERTGNDNLNQAVMLKTRYLLMRAPTHTYNAQTQTRGQYFSGLIPWNLDFSKNKQQQKAIGFCVWFIDLRIISYIDKLTSSLSARAAARS